MVVLARHLDIARFGTIRHDSPAKMREFSAKSHDTTPKTCPITVIKAPARRGRLLGNVIHDVFPFSVLHYALNMLKAYLAVALTIKV